MGIVLSQSDCNPELGLDPGALLTLASQSQHLRQSLNIKASYLWV